MFIYFYSYYDESFGLNEETSLKIFVENGENMTAQEIDKIVNNEIDINRPEGPPTRIQHARLTGAWCY